MSGGVRERVQAAIRELTEATLILAVHRNHTARETGYNVDDLEEKAADESKAMERIRAIRQELEDLEFTEYL